MSDIVTIVLACLVLLAYAALLGWLLTARKPPRWLLHLPVLGPALNRDEDGRPK